MPKYKKCPRCDLNYILEGEEFCKICQEELRGISHNTEDLDEIDEDGILCPRCHVNYLNEGETICESCAQEEEKGSVMDDIEPDWEDSVVEEEPLDDTDDLAGDEEIDELSLEELQAEEEEEEEEEDEYTEEAKDDLDELDDDIIDVIDDDDEDDKEDSDEDL